MLPAQRRARLIEMLRLEGAASLRSLAEALNTSLSTVRRDVEFLDSAGFVQRTHGGAILEPSRRTSFEPGSAIASAIASDAKRAIGRRAAELIEPRQTVLFDSGTTTLAAAQAACERAVPFTAVTNDLAIATRLSAAASVTVIMPGGMIRPGSPTLLGAATVRFLAALAADLAFIGTETVSDGRLSDTSLDLAEVKRTMVASANRVVLLADSSKFAGRSFCQFARVEDLDHIITDHQIRPATVTGLETAGVRLDQVPVGSAVAA